MSGCGDAQSWLAEQGTGLSTGLEQAALQMAHIARCAECSAVQELAKELVAAERSRCSYAVDVEQEEAFLAAAKGMAFSPNEVDEAFAYEAPEALELMFLTAAQQQAPQAAPRSRRWPVVLLLAAVALFALAWNRAPEEVSEPVPHVAVAEPMEQAEPIEVPTPVERVPVAPPEPVIVAVEEPSLKPGMTVKTERDALVLSDASNAQLAVAPETEFVVEQWSRELTRLALGVGTIEADVNHRGTGERFEIVTRNASIVVVGTVFSVTFDLALGTVVEGTSGKVRVEDREGRLLGFVRGGERLVVPLGGAAQRARALLAEGDEQAVISLLLAMERDSELEGLLGDAYSLASRNSEAQQSYSLALSLTDSPPERLFADLARLQAQAGDGAAAAHTWELYLKAHPKGARVAMAMLAVGEQELEVGRAPVAEEWLRRVVAGHAESQEGAVALARLAALLIAAERWGDLKNTLAPFVESNDSRGETALVGMARLELATGQGKQARQRLAQHAERFPEGVRGNEVARLLEAVRK